MIKKHDLTLLQIHIHSKLLKIKSVISNIFSSHVKELHREQKASIFTSLPQPNCTQQTI